VRATADQYAAGVKLAVEGLLGVLAVKAAGASAAEQAAHAAACVPAVLPPCILANHEPYRHGDWRKAPYAIRCAASLEVDGPLCTGAGAGPLFSKFYFYFSWVQGPFFSRLLFIFMFLFKFLLFLGSGPFFKSCIYFYSSWILLLPSSFCDRELCCFAWHLSESSAFVFLFDGEDTPLSAVTRRSAMLVAPWVPTRPPRLGPAP
jgi:hypothetical protein